MALLEVKGIHKDFISGTRTVTAVRDISFQIDKGEMVSIVGPSGAGKSTVLQICAGLMKPTGGRVLLNGEDFHRMESEKRAKFRRDNIGYIFQSYNLIPMLTARENIAVPSLLNDVKPSESTLNELAESLGIAERLEHFPDELSGGEQQRVAIARALINKPSIIFADEPTGNLDSENSRMIFDCFRRMNESGTTIVMVTHNPEIASACTRSLRIFDGTLG